LNPRSTAQTRKNPSAATATATTLAAEVFAAPLGFCVAPVLCAELALLELEEEEPVAEAAPEAAELVAGNDDPETLISNGWEAPKTSVEFRSLTSWMRYPVPGGAFRWSLVINFEQSAFCSMAIIVNGAHLVASWLARTTEKFWNGLVWQVHVMTLSELATHHRSEPPGEVTVNPGLLCA